MNPDIHLDLYKKLERFYAEDKVPNLLFHGKNGCGKKVLVNRFIDIIYTTPEDKGKYLLTIDCIQSNGIKFIRDDLKFFSQSQLNTSSCTKFKTVFLLNAGHLTIDAQSAMRRCIEQYSKTTRFFIIIEDKSKLLKPLLSRFCDFYVPLPTIGKKQINLYHYNRLENKQFKTKRYNWLKKTLSTLTYETLINITGLLYANAYSCIDLEEYIMKNKTLGEQHKQFILVHYHKTKSQFRNEKISIIHFLNNMLIRSINDLEYIYFM